MIQYLDDLHLIILIFMNVNVLIDFVIIFIFYALFLMHILMAYF